MSSPLLKRSLRVLAVAGLCLTSWPIAAQDQPGETAGEARHSDRVRVQPEIGKHSYPESVTIAIATYELMVAERKKAAQRITELGQQLAALRDENDSLKKQLAKCGAH